MNEKSQKLKSVIAMLVLVTTFLIPLLFLPITPEFFSFNKLIFVAIMTTAALILWAINTFVSKNLSIAKSPINIPLLAFVGTVGLSTIFSINKYVSLYGVQGKWFPSLFSILILVGLYYMVSSNIRASGLVKGGLLALFAGITIASLVTLISYYGIHLGEDPYLQNQWFTPVGSTTNATILAVVAMLLGLMLYIPEKNLLGKILLGLGCIANFLLILVTNLLPMMVILLVGIAALFFLVPLERLKREKFALLPLVGVLILLTVLAVIPSTRKVFIDKEYPKEIQLPVNESWKIVSSTIRDFPILGTGPGTFYLNFPRYKTITLNNTEAWALRFDKPYNEFFNILGTLGITGFVAALFLGVKIVKFTLHTSKTNDYSRALTLGILVLVASALFTHVTVTTAITLTLLLGFATASYNAATEGEKGYINITPSTAVNTIGSPVSDDSDVFRAILVIPLLALGIANGFFVYKLYPGEYFMNKAIVAASQNNGNLTYQYQAQAINLNPRNDVYRNTYAQTNLALARGLSTKENLTDIDKENIQTLVSQAIRSANISTEVLNPASVVGWEIRAMIYNALVGSAENADQWTIEALTTAVQLDPTNPRLRLDLGGIYYAKEDYLSAANLFRQATELKTDYANAYYNFGQAMLQLKEYAAAKKALETAQNLVTPESADYTLLAQELEKINAMPEVAGATTEKPTVEELERKTLEEAEIAPQEPLTNKGAETTEAQSDVVTE